MTPSEIRVLRDSLTRSEFAEELTLIARELLPSTESVEITERMIEGWEQGRRSHSPWAMYVMKIYQDNQ